MEFNSLFVEVSLFVTPLDHLSSQANGCFEDLTSGSSDPLTPFRLLNVLLKYTIFRLHVQHDGASTKWDPEAAGCLNFRG
jgi:hypothetical protein